MIGYILFAVFLVGANANNARLTGFDLNAYNTQQAALEAQQGLIEGQYNEIPYNDVGHWTNEVLALPRGATGVTITNHNINNVQMVAGYKNANSGGIGYEWLNIQGDITLHLDNAGVAYTYKRYGQKADILIPGPATPVSDFNFIVHAKRTSSNSGAGLITWKYTAP